jgi:competence protein CoiA
MKFALVDNTKAEPTKGTKGTCPNCGSELIAKCGNIKVHHWAHKGMRNCDPWWENETEWHRTWKNVFPLSWQEVIHTDTTGERHIADVKTDEGWVLEFQHSPIRSEERQARNAFYKRIVWVVDGGRLNDHKAQFQDVLNGCSLIKYGNINIFRTGRDNKSRLLREWAGSRIPVFFDFREYQERQSLRLWFLIPTQSQSSIYFLPFSVSDFIATSINQGLTELADKLVPDLASFLVRNEKRSSSFSLSLSPRRRSR